MQIIFPAGGKCCASSGGKKPQKQSRSPVSGLLLLLLQFGRAATTLPIPRVRFSGVRHQWCPSTTAVGPGWPRSQRHQTTPPRMEGNHLMMEEGMEGENVSMKEEGEICTKEADGHMKEDDTFEDTCNTTSSFSPSPAVSRRITMGVRGIRALEEWCRRAVQVRRHIQKCQTDIPVFSKILDLHHHHQHLPSYCQNRATLESMWWT